MVSISFCLTFTNLVLLWETQLLSLPSATTFTHNTAWSHLKCTAMTTGPSEVPTCLAEARELAGCVGWMATRRFLLGRCRVMCPAGGPGPGAVLGPQGGGDWSQPCFLLDLCWHCMAPCSPKCGAPPHPSLPSPSSPIAGTIVAAAAATPPPTFLCFLHSSAYRCYLWLGQNELPPVILDTTNTFTVLYFKQSITDKKM